MRFLAGVDLHMLHKLVPVREAITAELTDTEFPTRMDETVVLEIELVDTHLVTGSAYLRILHMLVFVVHLEFACGQKAFATNLADTLTVAVFLVLYEFVEGVERLPACIAHAYLHPCMYPFMVVQVQFIHAG